MPIYEFKCKRCRKVTEIMCHVSERPDKVKCSCGKMANPIISRGASLRDADVTWLPSARQVLQPDSEKPIETRQEWRKYLKDHNYEAAG